MEILDTVNNLDIVNSTNIIDSELKNRFKNGVFCPYCSSKNIKKHGKYKNRHRYICKDCFKSFNDLTCTVFSGTHNLKKWNNFLYSINNEVSLREEAKKIGLSHSTIFYWRHKVIRALNQDDNEGFYGITEVFHIRYPKTDKNPTHRFQKEHERIFQSLSRGGAFSAFVRPEWDRFWLVLTYERRGKITANVLDNNSRDSDFKEFFEKRIHKGNIFSTWHYAPITPMLQRMCKINKDIKLHNRDLGDSIYNPKYIFKFFKDYLDWQNNFYGISTKYILDYITWYKNLFYLKFEKSKESVCKLLKEILKNNSYLTNFSACL
ncbi:MAG: hypothetical protein ACERKV_04850 [Clostridiaceae bacterium]